MLVRNVVNTQHTPYIINSLKTFKKKTGKYGNGSLFFIASLLGQDYGVRSREP